MRKNIYICQKCRNSIVTVDLVDGVTPFMIACRAHSVDAKLLTNEDNLPIEELRKLDHLRKCNGKMQSTFYRVPHNVPEPTFEWYKPNAEEYVKLSKCTKEDHVDKGGLLLRPRR